MLLAAGELFSEEVATLEADAVAGDVLSVVRTRRARYEALGDANARSCLPRVVVLVEGNLLKVRRARR